APPTPAHIDSIQKQLPGGDGPVLPEVLNSLKKLAIDPDLTLSSSLVNALHELDWSLGLRHHALLTSPIWNSSAYLLFVHDLVGGADLVGGHYTGALESYRKENAIHSGTRPMPDMVVSPGAVEIPFWLDDLGAGGRTRPSVFRDEAGWILKLVGGEE